MPLCDQIILLTNIREEMSMSGIVYCVHKKELNRKQSVVSQTLKCDTLCEDLKSHIFHPWLGSCYFVCVSESFLFFVFCSGFVPLSHSVTPYSPVSLLSLQVL